MAVNIFEPGNDRLYSLSGLLYPHYRDGFKTAQQNCRSGLFYFSGCMALLVRILYIGIIGQGLFHTFAQVVPRIMSRVQEA